MNILFQYTSSNITVLSDCHELEATENKTTFPKPMSHKLRQTFLVTLYKSTTTCITKTAMRFQNVKQSQK